MVTSDHSLDHERGDTGIVALPDQILVGLKFPRWTAEGMKFRQLFAAEAGMLPQFPDQYVMRMRQSDLPRGIKRYDVRNDMMPSIESRRRLERCAFSGR